MKKKLMALYGLLLGMFALSYSSVYAIGIDPGTSSGSSENTVTIGSDIGKVTSLADAFRFVANLMSKVGWAGVIVGITIILALLVYKLVGSDDSEAMKTVQGGITKAVLIVIIGLLLLGAGFIVKTVAGLFGYGTGGEEDVPDYIPGELEKSGTTEDAGGTSGGCPNGQEQDEYLACDSNECHTAQKCVNTGTEANDDAACEGKNEGDAC